MTTAYELFWHNKFNPDELVRERGQRRGGGDPDKTIMPKLMRDLAPGQGVDIVAIWDRENRQAAATTGGNKSQAIRQRNEDRLLKLRQQQDERVIQSNMSTLGVLLSMRRHIVTRMGKLRWMLEILAKATEAKAHEVVLDCLFTLRDDDEFMQTRKHLRTGVTPSTPVEVLLAQYDLALRGAMGVLAGVEDIIEFQMTRMSNRLPPLGYFSFGHKLDVWQKRVLRMVDERRSVVVCAPTSSGKTVLSSYVVHRADKSLFVVPTEPLVWQVAAMLSQTLGGEVALATNQMVYSPRKENPREWRCIVGTPLALESALSKVRGRVGRESIGQQDYTIFRGTFADFSYAVYDEVHTLDDDEGEALQVCSAAASSPRHLSSDVPPKKSAAHHSSGPLQLFGAVGHAWQCQGSLCLVRQRPHQTRHGCRGRCPRHDEWPTGRRTERGRDGVSPRGDGLCPIHQPQDHNERGS
jgi:ATP-dependent RNA helicase DDX60